VALEGSQHTEQTSAISAPRNTGQLQGAIMPATGLTSPPLRELAHRISSGTDVTLFWNARTGALTTIPTPTPRRRACWPFPERLTRRKDNAT
jgi:hypothetical protein